MRSEKALIACQVYFAEFIGTAALLATVIGSGIMGEQLSGGNVAIALLGNTIPTGAILITSFVGSRPIADCEPNFADERGSSFAPAPVL